MKIEKTVTKTVKYNIELSENELEVLLTALGSVSIPDFSKEFGKENANDMMELYTKLRIQFESE
jgi:hypothetical protein